MGDGVGDPIPQTAPARTSPEGLHAMLVTRVVWLTHFPEFKQAPSEVLYNRTSRVASPPASRAPSGLKARAEMAPAGKRTATRSRHTS
jgi:hypothetical protein